MNKVILIGRLTRDAEIQSTINGIKYARFQVAVRRPYSTASKQQADFISIIAWRKQADFIEKYLKKGDRVAIDGQISTSTYTNKENKSVTRYEVIADKVVRLETRTEQEARMVSKTEELEMEKISSADDLNLELRSDLSETEIHDVPWDADLDVDL